MDIPSKHVYEVLSEKGVDRLFHANSVITACQFLRLRSLVSRGSIERRGLYQSSQTSDGIDKTYGVWFDVFMDSVDIHARARRANVYGPVLFVLDSKIITQAGVGRLWVTKLNPTKWADKSKSEKWFQSKKDLEEKFAIGQFDQMVVARHCGGELPLKNYLKKIVLDDPQEETGDDIDIHSMAVGALRLAMQNSGMSVPIEKRTCVASCRCHQDWTGDNERLLRMFDPKV